MDDSFLKDASAASSAHSESATMKESTAPFYRLVMECRGVISHDPPSVLPPASGVRHRIDLVVGTKYCVTRR